MSELRLNAESTAKQAELIRQQCARAVNKSQHAELLARAETTRQQAETARKEYLDALFTAERNRRFGGRGNKS